MSDKVPELIEDKDVPLSRTTKWRLRNRKVNPLRHFKIGRRIYYSREHIEELLRSSERGNSEGRSKELERKWST